MTASEPDYTPESLLALRLLMVFQSMGFKNSLAGKTQFSARARCRRLFGGYARFAANREE